MRLDADSYEILTQWFEAYSGALYRYARFFLHSDTEAQDVVQEVFMRVGEHMHSFRGDATVKTWVFRIARNYMVDLLHKKKRETDVRQLRAVNPSSSIDTLVELEDVLAGLPDPYRNVVILRLINGFNVEDTSEVLGWSPGKVRVTLHRAVLKLRRELGKDGFKSFSKEGPSNAIL